MSEFQIDPCADLNTLHWGLEQLSDEALQLQLWIDGVAEDGPPPFDDAVQRVLHDECLKQRVRSAKGEEELDPYLVELVKALDSSVGAVDQSLSMQALIVSAPMGRVRVAASELLAELESG